MEKRATVFAWIVLILIMILAGSLLIWAIIEIWESIYHAIKHS